MDPNKLNHANQPEQGKLIRTRPRSADARPQTRPRTEGWTQLTGPDGRPTLQFASPRVKQPPQHLADMTLEEREAKAVELGLPKFRAKQLSKHYFEHYTSDPAKMTDLPKDRRDELA